VIFLGDPEELSPDAAINFKILSNLAARNRKIKLIKFSSIEDLNELKKCKVIFDAMLGSGARGLLKEPYKSIVEKLNKFKSIKIAVDIPTGLDADTGAGEVVFRADLTITLAALKKGLFFGEGYANAGRVILGNIGIDESYSDLPETNTYLIEPEDAYNSLPWKKKNIHKYSSGKVLVIAGSGAFPGAAVLTCKAAFKTGAGAVILSFPKSVRKLIHKSVPEVVIQAYEDNGNEFLASANIESITEKLKWADVAALGPGLGRNKKTGEAVHQIINKKAGKKLILDADALYAISNGKYKDFNLKDCILTPHLGEFSALINADIAELKSDLLQYGSRFVEETKSYLILKGAPTIIFLPNGEIFINSAGNPGMAKFGTGDVLTGIIAGFSAQIKETETALIAAVYLHSLAADLLLNKYTEFGFTANDIIEKIPDSIKFLRKSFA
jgi:NAD(P)H-hydrate epimerase